MLSIYSKKVASSVKVQLSHSVPGDVYGEALLRGSKTNKAAPSDGSGV